MEEKITDRQKIFWSDYAENQFLTDFRLFFGNLHAEKDDGWRTGGQTVSR